MRMGEVIQKLFGRPPDPALVYPTPEEAAKNRAAHAAMRRSVMEEELAAGIFVRSVCEIDDDERIVKLAEHARRAARLFMNGAP